MATPHLSNLKNLEPDEILIPFYKRIRPWGLGLIGLVPYAVIQFFRVGIEGRPFWPEHWVIAIGDPLIAVFMFAAAYAFQGFEIRRPERLPRLHKALWFIWLLSIAPVAMYINYLKEGQVNLMMGSAGSIVHSVILVPVFAVLVVGVIPQLLFYVRGHRVARYTAISSLVIYVITLFLN